MWKLIGKSALVLGLLAGGCGGAGHPVSRPAASAIDLAQSTGVTAGDRIDGLDLALDAQGNLHAVWRHTHGREGASRGRLMYRRGSGKPLRWSAPVVISTVAPGMPQVVARANGVHVFAGPRLHHWQLMEPGRVHEHGALLDRAAPQVDAFDALAAGNGISIVFRTSPLRSGLGLYGLHWTQGGAAAPRPIAQALPSSSPGRAAPRLHGAAGRLLAIWTETRSSGAFDASSGVTSFQARDEILASWSTDGGVHWSPPARVASTPGSDVAAVAVADSGGSPVVFYAAHGVFSSHWQGNAWSPAAQRADHSAQSAPGATDITAVTAASCEGAPAVAWADARHRRTDRRWWNPLGGAPWSDNPDWANNDVFVIERAFARQAGGPRPQRLTQDGSYTGEIAMTARDGQLVVLHSGQARVGKSRHDANAAPHLLQSLVPCS